MEWILAAGAAYVALKGMTNAGDAQGKEQRVAAATMVPGKNTKFALGDHIADTDSAAQSTYNRRLKAGDFRNPIGQRYIRHQAPTQLAASNSNYALRQYYYTQTPHRRNPPVRSVVPYFTDSTQRLGDNYKEFMRAQLYNALDRDVPFRSYRADWWPDRERRRVPFFNNPNSCFHGSDLKVGPNAFSGVNMPLKQRSKTVLQYQPSQK